MQNRGHLLTETQNPRSAALDQVSVPQAVDIMLAEDATISAAVAATRDDVAAAIDLVVNAFRNDGRLFYVGAGTSGRLGVLDASECPPTFLSDPKMVQGIIAGGWDALRMAVEGAEDLPEDGAAAITEKQVGANDVVCGWREPNVIRVAPAPLYNSFEDCWHFVERLHEALEAS